MRYSKRIGFLFAAALLLSALLGCTWMEPRSIRAGFDLSGWNLTPAQKDTLKALFKEMGKLEKENSSLKKKIEAERLDLAKLKAENENLLELVTLQKQEIDNARRDLEYVEKQFISLEAGFQHGETKASAVAALAGASIALERLLSNATVSLDSAMAEELRMKLARSESCLKNSQYSASVYYANRVLRETQALERLGSLGDIQGKMRIVSARVANIREGPGKEYKVVDRLSYGAVLVQLGSQGSWCKVRSRAGKEGWIYADLVR